MPQPAIINGFSAGQKAALAQARENTASGIPAVVLDAVVPASAQVCGRPLQPFYPRTYAILRRINSAFTGAKVDQANEVDDVVRAIYVMTTPIELVKTGIAKGIESFTEAAYEAVGEAFELRHVPQIAAAIANHIGGGFATVPGGRDAVEDNGGPKAAAASPAAPARAGGSV